MTYEEIIDVVFSGMTLEMTPNEQEKIESAYTFLKDFARDKVIYGINTGFGPMAQYRIDDKDLLALQYNIIRSHATGAGKPLETIYVRAAMLARYLTFVSGNSGVHLDTVRAFQTFINKGVYPFVPEHGSVGASGDLVQLAHVALTLIGEGYVFYNGEKRPTAEVLRELGIQPLRMYIRDGLSIVNGTAVMSGIGMVNLYYAQKLFDWSLIFSTMINEIASSYDDCFSQELNGMKHHEGQHYVAAEMRRIAAGSRCFKDRQAELYQQQHQESYFGNEVKVQPYYSLRCVPQILGPVYDELVNARKVLVNEYNSVDDNPVLDVATRNVYHGGNFHGDYVSFEMDKLKIAVTMMTMLSERQLNYLFHDRINGILPPFVNLGHLGLNYGLQAAQFTATSTTAESQTLSNPVCVHSIPNNNDNQDVVSMGTNSALLARRVIDNGYQVAAIQCMALVQAVDCLKIQDKLSPVTRKFYDEVRAIVPAFVEDTPKYEEIEHLQAYLKDN